MLSRSVDEVVVAVEVIDPLLAFSELSFIVTEGLETSAVTDEGPVLLDMDAEEDC